MMANVRRRAASRLTRSLSTIIRRYRRSPPGRRGCGPSVGRMPEAPSDPAVTPSVPVVTDVPDNHRYEIRLDGELAGFVVYHRRGGRIYLVHTEIEPAFEGKGLGSALARDVLA